MLVASQAPSETGVLQERDPDDANASQPRRRRVLEMNRPDKGVLLRLFHSHNMKNVMGSSLRSKWENIAVLTREEPCVQASPKE